MGCCCGGGKSWLNATNIYAACFLLLSSLHPLFIPFCLKKPGWPFQILPKLYGLDVGIKLELFLTWLWKSEHIQRLIICVTISHLPLCLHGHTFNK